MDKLYHAKQSGIASKKNPSAGIILQGGKLDKYSSATITNATHQNTIPASFSFKSKKALTLQKTPNLQNVGIHQKLKKSTKSTSKVLLPTEKSEEKMDHIMANISLPIKQKNIHIVSPSEKLTHTKEISHDNYFSDKNLIVKLYNSYYKKNGGELKISSEPDSVTDCLSDCVM